MHELADKHEDRRTDTMVVPSEDASVGMSRKPLMLVGDVPVGAVESAENSGKTAPGSGTTLVETGNTEEATFTARVNVVYKITLCYEVCVKNQTLLRGVKRIKSTPANVIMALFETS